VSSSAIHKQQQPETFCQSAIYLQGLPPPISRVYHHLSTGFSTCGPHTPQPAATRSKCKRRNILKMLH